MEDDGSFEKACPYCSGTGRVQNLKLIEWQLNDFRGEEPTEVLVPCPICNGIGVIPTPMGFNILDFVERYGGHA